MEAFFEVLSSEFTLFTNIFSSVVSFNIFFMVVAGTFLGLVVGAIPGMTATMTLALLIGITYNFGFERAIALLIGIYVGAIYGGCIASIMINIPGTPSAAATVFDGFPLAKKGEGGLAIGVGTITSFYGMIIGIICLILFTPIVYQIALKIGAWEYFFLAIFGVAICGNLSSSEQPIKGWIAGFLGLFVSTIGLDPIYNYPRFTFGNSQLLGGIFIIPALIGVFGISEIVNVLKEKVPYSIPKKIGPIIPKLKTLKKYVTNGIRSGLVGVFIGAVPGVGEATASFIAYDMAKRASKEPETFGKGNYQGVVAAETANNACIGGALIPILTLGIPGSVGTALLMAAMIVHGVRPGPMLRTEFPGFTYHVFILMLIASVAMLVLGLLLARPLIALLKIRRDILMPIIVPLCVIGAYAANLRYFDMRVMIVIGILAYIFRWLEYPLPPLVLGLILGDMADVQFRRAMLISGGDPTRVFSRPISVALIIIIILMLFFSTGIGGRISRRISKAFSGSKK
jgi:putative tricarboxylic transport membrane protein